MPLLEPMERLEDLAKAFSSTGDQGLSRGTEVLILLQEGATEPRYRRRFFRARLVQGTCSVPPGSVVTLDVFPPSELLEKREKYYLAFPITAIHSCFKYL